MLQEHSKAIARIPVVRVVGGLTRYQHSVRYEVVAEAIVDRRDAKYVRQFRWNFSGRVGNHYVRQASKRRRCDPREPWVYLHGLIWERHRGPIPEGMTPDHINRDSLDNRLENLRLATTAQQGYNKGVPASSTTGRRGVHFNEQYGCYKPGIRFTDDRGRHRVWLGSYKDIEEASVARNVAVRLVHGEFGVLTEVTPGSVSEGREIEIAAFVASKLGGFLPAAPRSDGYLF